MSNLLNEGESSNQRQERKRKNESASESKSSGFIRQLFLNERTADVYFVFFFENPPVRIAAHKSILAVSTIVFDTMFYGKIPEKGDVEIKDVSSKAFTSFLNYLYNARCEYSPENIAEIAYLADKYMFQKLKSGCEEYLMNLIDREQNSDFMVYELSLLFNYEALQAKCRSFIQNYITTFVTTDEFLQCNRIVVTELMKWNRHISVLEGCMRWAQNKCEETGVDAKNALNLRNAFGKGWKEIPFDQYQLSLDHFVSFENKYSVFSFDEYKSLIGAINERQKQANPETSRSLSTPMGQQNGLVLEPIEVFDSEDEIEMDLQ